MPTIEPAFVRPRIISPVSGETLLLADVVSQELASGSRVIQISGGQGSGKSTALAHLSATLPESNEVVFLDDASNSEVSQKAVTSRVICTGRLAFHDARPHVVLPLAWWTDDELIEYLASAAPDQCGSVMRRVAASPAKTDIRGNPALWRAVLDQFLADDALTSIRAAIQRILAAALADHRERRFAADFCLAILFHDDAELTRTLGYIMRGPADFERLRLLKHPLVQCLLAGERIAKLILSDGECPALTQRLPRPLIEELAGLAARDSVLAERLHAIYASDRVPYHAQAATILFATDRTWRPHANRKASLAGGRFREAAWAGLKLLRAKEGVSNLSAADLTRANLQGAQLDGVVARGAQLSDAWLNKASLVGVNAEEVSLDGARLVAASADRINLRRANLKGATFDDASLVGAELHDADLSGATFRKADLAYAVLVGSKVEGADFTGADLDGCCLTKLVLREATLDGASFHAADLARCDLEGVVLPQADFRRAKLKGALLTGSVMPHADFRQADLRIAGLADIHWEDADLREADLRGCTFHMGSTRSGLVGSPYPGHGSKTGFYTDDYHDQGFKRPEEIRKANLCGADLRGAKLDYVDFYLVDLRGARFESGLAGYLRDAGAILHDHCA